MFVGAVKSSRVIIFLFNYNQISLQMGGKRKYNRFAQRKRERKELAKADYRDKPGHKTYEFIVRENKEFDEYYKGQNICTEEEWPVFLKSIKEDLPTAFRITGSRGEANALLEIVQGTLINDIMNQAQQEANSNDKVQDLKPFHLPWYPDKLAWQLQLTRKDIRRSEAYFRLHNFLIAETNSGNISRQEAVSMIPPIVLDVQPHHKILDMCAAPGSKTAQLIEMLHLNTENSLPTGFVVANDVDNNRCYMLVHQAKRLNSPCILITNHDSAIMPNLTVTDKDNLKCTLKYDRILCDVPCSGDGTLRKNPDIWLKWNVANGNNLHGIQSRILRRGAELLAVGGRIVYSTCSLNPIENEAVIHRLLSDTQGSLQIINPRDKLPGLKSNPGMDYWRPGTRDMKFYETFDEVPEKWHTVVRPQMFPPKPEDKEKYNLHKCMRILPHQQDTGGFFVAVLEKLKPLPWESEYTPDPSVLNATDLLENKSEKLNTAETISPWGPQRKKRRIGGYREDPFVFFKDDEEFVWKSIKDFYSISPDFDPKCLLTRCKNGKKKNVYFCSSAIRNIIVNNEHKIKLINTGVKTFVRCDNKNMKCAFRLAQEGLESIFPFVGSGRKLKVTKEDLITMLLNNNPLQPPDITTLSEQSQEQFKNIDNGSCVLTYEDKDNSLILNLVGWKGIRSLRAYVALPETVHMLRLLGADISKFDVNKFKKNEDININETESTEEIPSEEMPSEEIPSEEIPCEKMPCEQIPSEKMSSEEVTGEGVPNGKTV